MKARKFYAVRVIVVELDGDAYQQDYVRGSMQLSRQAFAAFALGSLLQLVDAHRVALWSVEEVSAEQVRVG